MVNGKRIVPTVWLIFCGLVLLSPQEADDTTQRLELAGIDEAGPPRFVNGNVVLTYDAARPIRYVAAAFANEDFTRLHHFERNDQGVFLLSYPVPADLERIRYRLVVDGLWTTDPNSPETSRGVNGVRISVAELPDRPDPEPTSPVVLSGRQVRFVLDLRDQGSISLTTIGRQALYLDAPEGHRVAVVGSFNNWDPFMHRLKEDDDAPGLYRSNPIRVSRRTHRYYFLVDGRRVLDPANPERSFSTEGFMVSTFTLSPSRAASR